MLVMVIFISPAITIAQALPTNGGTAVDGALLPPLDGDSGIGTIEPVPMTVGADTQIGPQQPITNPYNSSQAANLNPNYVNSQINTYITTASTTSTNTGAGSGTRAAAGAVGCGAGQILSSLITSSVSSAIGGAAGTAAGSMLNVPTAESGQVGDNIKTETSARVGTVMGFAGISGLAAPSWDAVGYCIVNAMIIYIADSTIQWINTGFKGNPAFLNNPDQFFKQLANEEAASFVQNLAYGVTGVNVCDVFRSVMVASILKQYQNQRGYGSGYQNGGYNRGINNGYLGCSFDQNPNQLNSFVRGNFIQGGGWNSWYKMTQDPKSNPYNVYLSTMDRLNATVLTAQSSANRELTWNNGWLNYKKCTNEKDPKTCTTVTPGTVIQNQLNETLNLGKNRLVLAEKFDQVVNALVNQLITTALGKALESTAN